MDNPIPNQLDEARRRFATDHWFNNLVNVLASWTRGNRLLSVADLKQAILCLDDMERERRALEAAREFTASEHADHHIGNCYICERCNHAFELDLFLEKKCPACGTEFVRKFRESDLDVGRGIPAWTEKDIAPPAALRMKMPWLSVDYTYCKVNPDTCEPTGETVVCPGCHCRLRVGNAGTENPTCCPNCGPLPDEPTIIERPQ